MARRRRRPLPRGWYEKDGDPPGTERFWDGEKWGPNPRQKRGAPQADKSPPAEAVVGAGEAVAISEDGAATLPLATIPARISARSADMLIVLVPWYFVWIRAFRTVTVQGTDGPTEAIATANSWFLWLAAGLVIVYEAAFVGTMGATPGKRLLGLTVASKEDLQSPPGWWRAIMRATPLLLLVAVVLVPVLWVASVVAMVVDRQKRSVFDFSAGTVVLVDPTRPPRWMRNRSRRR